MKYYKLTLFALFTLAIASCSDHPDPKYPKDAFGYALKFLTAKDSSLVILTNNSGYGEVLVSPKYEGKVFTTTTMGEGGKSLGWINFGQFGKHIDPHMNPYGGEDRLWLGPEGGKYSLFFKPGTSQVFDNWHTPGAVDTGKWQLDTSSNKMAQLSKATTMQNYAGTNFQILLRRKIQLIETDSIGRLIGIKLAANVNAVGYTTTNTIINTGDNAWDKTTGAPCLWNLDMFNPSPSVDIAIPYNTSATGPVATTNYFGQIPPDRVRFLNGTIFFKADGKQRGKLGVPPGRVKSYAGSYDAANNVLTIITYDFDPKGTYLNQQWKTDVDPLDGDAVNAYNDGPLANGTQMGPFYEMESVSPAAFLQPGDKLTHKHTVLHFTGDTDGLNAISLKTLGVSIEAIKSSL